MVQWLSWGLFDVWTLYFVIMCQCNVGFALRQNLTLAPKETKVAAYQALVHPQLEYAAPTCIWKPHHQTEIDQIGKVQRTAASWACRRWHNQSQVRGMLEELQWPELHERRQQASLTYKIHNNLVTIDKNRYLSEAGCNRNTRSHPFQYHRPNVPSSLNQGLHCLQFPLHLLIT